MSPTTKNVGEAKAKGWGVVGGGADTGGFVYGPVSGGPQDVGGGDTTAPFTHDPELGQVSISDPTSPAVMTTKVGKGETPAQAAARAVGHHQAFGGSGFVGTTHVSSGEVERPHSAEKKADKITLQETGAGVGYYGEKGAVRRAAESGELELWRKELEEQPRDMGKPSEFMFAAGEGGAGYYGPKETFAQLAATGEPILGRGVVKAQESYKRMVEKAETSYPGKSWWYLPGEVSTPTSVFYDELAPGVYRDPTTGKKMVDPDLAIWATEPREKAPLDPDDLTFASQKSVDPDLAIWVSPKFGIYKDPWTGRKVVDPDLAMWRTEQTKHKEVDMLKGTIAGKVKKHVPLIGEGLAGLVGSFEAYRELVPGQPRVPDVMGAAYELILRGPITRIGRIATGAMPPTITEKQKTRFEKEFTETFAPMEEAKYLYENPQYLTGGLIGEAAQWGLVFPAIGKLAAKAVKASPIKIGTTPIGKPSVWKGIYTQRGRKVTPLIGISEGKLTRGLPMVALKEEALAKGIQPLHPLDTKLATDAWKDIAKEGKYPLEIQRLDSGIRTMELLEKQKALRAEAINIAEIEHIPKATAKDVEGWIKSQKEIIVFGSAAQKAQMKPTARIPRDIDILVKDEAKAAQELLDIMSKKAPGRIRISPESPHLIEAEIGGKWRHAIDIHSLDRVDVSGSLISSEMFEYVGFGFKRKKPIKVEGISMVTLGEQMTRKGSSTVQLRKGFVDPASHRVKDIADFEATAKQLIEYGKESHAAKAPILGKIKQGRMAEAERQLGLFKSTRRAEDLMKPLTRKQTLQKKTRPSPTVEKTHQVEEGILLYSSEKYRSKTRYPYRRYSPRIGSPAYGTYTSSQMLDSYSGATPLRRAVTPPSKIQYKTGKQYSSFKTVVTPSSIKLKPTKYSPTGKPVRDIYRTTRVPAYKPYPIGKPSQHRYPTGDPSGEYTPTGKPTEIYKPRYTTTGEPYIPVEKDNPYDYPYRYPGKGPPKIRIVRRVPPPPFDWERGRGKRKKELLPRQKWSGWERRHPVGFKASMGMELFGRRKNR